jgi:hypothetical protein
MQYLPQFELERLTQLLNRWCGAHPEMGVLALVPEAEKAGVEGLQKVCRDLGVPVVGAIFPALIEGGAFRDKGLWLLRFDVMPFAALYADLPLDGDPLQARVDALVADLKPHLPVDADTTLFLLFDSMVPNIGSLLDELYLRLANRVHYMGANAGSESFQPMPCLFDAGRIVGNGVLALLLPRHRGAILDHGYGVPEQMITATSTEGNRIRQIDWRPAFEVYREMARMQYGVAIDRDNFYQYAVHFPFGIVRANGITLVRIPVALEEDGSLFCVGEVPANSVLTLLEAPRVDSRHTLETICAGLTAANGALDGRELLLFYCAGRRLHLGVAAATAELGGLFAHSHIATLAGALSLGEIGSTVEGEYPLFHNATLVASLWSPTAS